MTQINRIRSALALSLLLVIPMGFAASCYEKSPNLTSLADKYYDIDGTAPLTPLERKAIASILRNITGRWAGQGTSFQCFGSELDPRPEIKKFTIKANLSGSSSAELTLDVEKHVELDKTKSLEHLLFFGTLDYYESVIISGNSIELVEKYRRKVNEDFLPLQEVIYSMEIGAANINYSMRRYINGHLAIEEKWSLTRNR